MKKKQEPSLVERALSPTPKFFRTLRTIGLSLAAVAGAILTAPVAIPATITTVAAYLAVLGGALSAVAQVTVEGE